MRKHLLGSATLALLLVGAGCVGVRAPSSDANAPTPLPAVNENVNAGRTDGSNQVPGTKSAAFGSDVSLAVGDSAAFSDGMTVTLTKINDSRCPKDVQCIWQGELAPVLSLKGGTAGSQAKEVTLGTVRTLLTLSSGYSFSLREATAASVKINVSKDATAAQLDDRIRVTSPAPGEAVSSPLTVTGEARGTWYFEASFPAELQDANGKVLAQTPAQAKGDWMTDKFVPFSVTLIFPKPATPTGTLILHRDNPSGLPQNEASVSIPVTFTAQPK